LEINNYYLSGKDCPFCNNGLHDHEEWDEEHIVTCEDCKTEFCNECSQLCQECYKTVCPKCQIYCEICLEPYCPKCISKHQENCYELNKEFKHIKEEINKSNLLESLKKAILGNYDDLTKELIDKLRG
jgi:hypothetical protein